MTSPLGIIGPDLAHTKSELSQDLKRDLSQKASSSINLVQIWLKNRVHFAVCGRGEEEGMGCFIFPISIQFYYTIKIKTSN